MKSSNERVRQTGWRALPKINENARGTAGGSSSGYGSWRRHRSLILATPSRCIAQVSLRCPAVLDVRPLGEHGPAKPTPRPSCGALPPCPHYRRAAASSVVQLRPDQARSVVGIGRIGISQITSARRAMVDGNSIAKDRPPLRRHIVLARWHVADFIGFVGICPGMIGIAHDSADRAGWEAARDMVCAELRPQMGDERRHTECEHARGDHRPQGDCDYLIQGVI